MLNLKSSGIRSVVIVLAVMGLLGRSFCAPAFGQTPQPQAPTAAPTAAAEPNDPNGLKDVLVSTPEPESADAAAKLTLDELLARRRQAADSADLADDVKSRLAEVYDRAIAHWKLAEELAGRRNHYSQTAKTAPQDLAEIKSLLAQPATTARLTAAPDMSLTEAEQKLTQTTVLLEEIKKKAAELESEPKRRAERRTKIPEESNSARQQLDEIQQKLTTAAGQDQPSALTQANRIALELQRKALEARIAANTDELVFYDTTNDLLAGQRDLAARRLAAHEKIAAFWQEKVSALRQRAAQTAKEEAVRVQRQTQHAHPLIQDAARKNADLARLQTELVNKIERTTQYAATVDEQLAALESDFAEIREQVDRAGRITNVLGLRLLSKRNALPRMTDNRRRIRNRPAEIAQVHFEWIEYDDAWSHLSNIEQRVENLFDQAETTVTWHMRDAIRPQLIESLQTQRKTLKALSDLALDHATRLANLDAKERALIRTVDTFAVFIDANILWVRSSHPVAPSDLRGALEALAWLLAPANWLTVASALWGGVKDNPLIVALAVLVGAVGIAFRRTMRERIETISEQVRQVYTDRFLFTIQALVLTILLAATWPTLLLLVSWRLSVRTPSDFVRALASGLTALAPALFVLSFLKHVSIRRGLGQSHFRLREESLVFLRRHLRWFSLIVLPAVFVLEAMHAQQASEAWYNTVGRLVFAIGLIGLTLFLLVVIRPTSPLMDVYLKQRRGSWLDRLRYLWYPVCLLVPLSLAVLAAMGYLYGARYLNEKLLWTIGLILLILLTRAMFVRGLIVAQRRLALLEREKRRAAAEQKSQDGQAPSGEMPETVAQPEPTIFEMSQQTRRLIGAVTTIFLVAGFWYLWEGVLPAFAKLGEYPLYLIGHNSITLGEVVTALVVTVLTVIVARNVPGLLEIIVLRRLPIDRGVRFAIITISRYVLVMIGVVWAFTEIGIGWSKVQWLIAAMTVGLGFGLQEIFANFISGLIILFEQPIRVDDTVTVGDVTGRVTMINIRATTIRRWDQRELIVPNREFVTGPLINWTLSDSTLRRDFAVGIAYGSDIRKAEQLLYQIAATDERVLKEPPPMVLFRGFGSSSLDFELRVYYSGIEHRLTLWHDLNVAIDDTFREAGIEIAFPQQDVHLRSVGLDIPLHLKQPSQVQEDLTHEILR